MSFFRRKSSSSNANANAAVAASPQKEAKTPSSPFNARKAVKSAIPEWEDVLNNTKDDLRVWRLGAKEELTPIAESDEGFFYSDESYIVVKSFTYKQKLRYNIHFWFGAEKAKKTITPPSKVQQLVELLNKQVVVYREVEGFESPVFRRYFKVFGVQKGNSAGAFDVNNAGKYRKRLLHFRENRLHTRVEVQEVPISRKSLVSKDVYIYDEGTKMTQWNGKKCDDVERTTAKAFIQNELAKRKTTCTSEFNDEEDLFDGAAFYKEIGNAPVPPRPMKLEKNNYRKSMWRLSDKSGKLTLTSVPVSRDCLFPEDVVLVDTRGVIYAQIGPTSSEKEKSSVWTETDKYLKNIKVPFKSICLFHAGSYCEPFEQAWVKGA